jgi:hypothetical protein
MLRQTKRCRAAAAAALAAASLVPVGATPAHAAAVCQVKVLGAHSEGGQFVAITGTYRGPADAREVKLTCGVVRDGATVARATDKVAGPVAALAEVQTVYGTGLIACHEVTIFHLDGSISYFDACP